MAGIPEIAGTSDFTKHFNAYENRRQQLLRKSGKSNSGNKENSQKSNQVMPFEIAESQKEAAGDPLAASNGTGYSGNQELANSNLFVDNRALFDGISQLQSELPSIQQKEQSQSLLVMVTVL